MDTPVADVILTAEDRRRLPPLLLWVLAEAEAIADRPGLHADRRENSAARAWASDLLLRLRGAA